MTSQPKSLASTGFQICLTIVLRWRASLLPDILHSPFERTSQMTATLPYKDTEDDLRFQCKLPYNTTQFIVISEIERYLCSCCILLTSILHRTLT